MRDVSYFLANASLSIARVYIHTSVTGNSIQSNEYDGSRGTAHAATDNRWVPQLPLSFDYCCGDVLVGIAALPSTT